MQATIDVIDLSRPPLRRLEMSTWRLKHQDLWVFWVSFGLSLNEALAPDFDVLSNDFGRSIRG